MKPKAPSVGIDLGGTKLLLVAETEGGRVVERLPTGLAFGPADLEAAIRSFTAAMDVSAGALGIAVPGLVRAGEVVACDTVPRLVGWRPPYGLGGAALVTVVNDGDAALAFESADAPSGATLAVVLAGTGIGAAFQVDGRPCRGTSGWAGELGSIPIATGDVTRPLDALASGEALVRRLGGSGAEVAARVAAGDRRACAAVQDAGRALGLGLATMIHLLNPSQMAVGGGLTRLPGYLEAAVLSAQRHTLPPLWEACTVRAMREGDLAVALGAALAARRATALS